MALTTKQITSRIFIAIALLVLVGGYGVAAWLSVPKATVATTTALTLPKVSSTPIAWPSYGETALAVNSTSVLITNGDQVPHPIASIAKTILALALTKQKPISADKATPTITFTDADIAIYKTQLSQNGSVVPIASQEQLSEYQALQALLLPSGNNIADSLAIWGFGTNDAYLMYANQMVADMGLTQTHLADASGYSPQTVSSARDLVVLGQALMKDPILAEVVGQSTTTLPVAGAVKNVNSLLGKNDIVGIKTGNTDQAGGCLLFASQGTSANGGATIIGAILGAKDLSTVLQDTSKLLETNRTNFQPITVAKAGQTVATYTTAWGETVHAVTAKDFTVYSPLGTQITTTADAQPLKSPAAAGTTVGTLKATMGSSEETVPLVLSTKLEKPRLLWRLTHPLALFGK